MTTKTDKADQRILRVYGKPLGWYAKQLAVQNGVCAICKRPPVNFRLNVDHDHRFDKAKIQSKKVSAEGVWNDLGFSFVWKVWAVDPHGNEHSFDSPNRAKAREEVRRYLRRASVRGLLCYICNKGLAYYRDTPERLERAGAYLRTFNEKALADSCHTDVSTKLLDAAKRDCALLFPSTSPGRDGCSIQTS